MNVKRFGNAAAYTDSSQWPLYGPPSYIRSSVYERFLLPGAAHNIQFDQPVESALLLVAGGPASGTGMVLSTRFAAIVLKALGNITMKTTKLHKASCSVAAA